jgi:hypothetical protein
MVGSSLAQAVVVSVIGTLPVAVDSAAWTDSQTHCRRRGSAIYKGVLMQGGCQEVRFFMSRKSLKIKP